MRQFRVIDGGAKRPIERRVLRAVDEHIRGKRWAAPDFVVVYLFYDNKRGKVVASVTIEHLPAMCETIRTLAGWRHLKGGRWRKKVMLEELPETLELVGRAIVESSGS